MFNDYRYYNELYHFGFFKKSHRYIDRIKLKNGKWRYIYPEDLITSSDLKTNLGKKLYKQTVAERQAEADRQARTTAVVKDISTGKKISNTVYVDHENHFPFDTNKNQIASTTYWTDSSGKKHKLRNQFDVNDDRITYKDLRDTFISNVKRKHKSNKFKRKQKFENFLEKYFGYKDPKKVISEIENREFNKRINSKMASVQEEQLKSKLRNMSKNMNTKKLSSLFNKLNRHTKNKRTINIIKGTSHGTGNRG